MKTGAEGARQQFRQRDRWSGKLHGAPAGLRGLRQRLARHQVLAAFIQVALNHHPGDRAAARPDLTRHIARHGRLIAVNPLHPLQFYPITTYYVHHNHVN